MRHNILLLFSVVILASSCADPVPTSDSPPTTIQTPPSNPVVTAKIDSTSTIDSSTVVKTLEETKPKIVPTSSPVAKPVTKPIAAKPQPVVKEPTPSAKPAQPMVDNTQTANHNNSSTSSQNNTTSTIVTSTSTINSNTVTTKPPVYSKIGPRASFSTKTQSYGQIKEGTEIDKSYYFTNTGDEPLEILNVDVTCGCTVPTYSFMPILPGASSKIDVHFESKGKMSAQKATITVLTNAKTNPSTKLYLEGYVMPIWKDEKKDSSATKKPKVATPPTTSTQPANKPPKANTAPTTTTQPKSTNQSAPTNSNNTPTKDTTTSNNGN